MREFSDINLEMIADTLHNWIITPSGTEGMRTAEVCTGGVDTAELSSKTFEAKNNRGFILLAKQYMLRGILAVRTFHGHGSPAGAVDSSLGLKIEYLLLSPRTPTK